MQELIEGAAAPADVAAAEAAEKPARKKPGRKPGPKPRAKPRAKLAEPEAGSQATGRPRWSVRLNAFPPVVFPTLEVEAEDEEQARKAYCAAMNISGSECNWQVSRVG